MALQILPILQVIVILCAQSTYSYPIYGTKRYGRSAAAHRAVSGGWNPYQQMVRTQRYPVSYYELYPYTQSYADDYYYPQETYPMYYPARTSKYEVYQAVLPYYYGDRPSTKPGYGYYGYNDNDPSDLQDEILQEAEREQREDSQPIGQEMLYENEDVNTKDTLDEVNAAFLQNLIMSQVYKDAVNTQKDYYDTNPYGEYYQNDDGYGRWEETSVEPKPNYRQEDEDVRELKQLAKPKLNKQDMDNIHWFQNRNYRNQGSKRSTLAKSPSAFKKEEFSEHGPTMYGTHEIAFSDRKASAKLSSSTTSTTAAPVTEEIPKTVVAGGQKEEVLARPATPVRHPFSAPVLDMMKSEEEQKRTPSVYDTIKHMLDMEKNLEKVSTCFLKFIHRELPLEPEIRFSHTVPFINAAPR